MLFATSCNYLKAKHYITISHCTAWSIPNQEKNWREKCWEKENWSITIHFYFRFAFISEDCREGGRERVISFAVKFFHWVPTAIEALSFDSTNEWKNRISSDSVPIMASVKREFRFANEKKKTKRKKRNQTESNQRENTLELRTLLDCNAKRRRTMRLHKHKDMVNDRTSWKANTWKDFFPPRHLCRNTMRKRLRKKINKYSKKKKLTVSFCFLFFQILAITLCLQCLWNRSQPNNHIERKKLKRLLVERRVIKYYCIMLLKCIYSSIWLTAMYELFHYIVCVSEKDFWKLMHIGPLFSLFSRRHCQSNWIVATN